MDGVRMNENRMYEIIPNLFGIFIYMFPIFINSECSTSEIEHMSMLARIA